MSPAARKRISDAQKARHAKNPKTGETGPVVQAIPRIPTLSSLLPQISTVLDTLSPPQLQKELDACVTTILGAQDDTYGARGRRQAWNDFGQGICNIAGTKTMSAGGGNQQS